MHVWRPQASFFFILARSIEKYSWNHFFCCVYLRLPLRNTGEFMLRPLPNMINIILEFKTSAPHGSDFTDKSFTPQQHKISSWILLKCKMHFTPLNKISSHNHFVPAGAITESLKANSIHNDIKCYWLFLLISHSGRSCVLNCVLRRIVIDLPSRCVWLQTD